MQSVPYWLSVRFAASAVVRRVKATTRVFTVLQPLPRVSVIHSKFNIFLQTKIKRCIKDCG